MTTLDERNPTRIVGCTRILLAQNVVAKRNGTGHRLVRVPIGSVPERYVLHSVEFIERYGIVEVYGLFVPL